MNTPDIETRLKQAAAVAAPPRSVVDEVMGRLPLAELKPALRSRWRHPVWAAGLAALTGIAAVVAFIFFLTGPAVRLTLADVQAAVEKQAWVHVRYDLGVIKEEWTNLQTGEMYFAESGGVIVYLNDETNIRLRYEKNSGEIYQDTPTEYDPGHTPPKWTPQSAWEQVVGPLEHRAAERAAATTRPAGPSERDVVSAQDTLNGIAVIRFDEYLVDSLDHRFLYRQLWADPRTHLPLRIKTRLYSGERWNEKTDKEWSTGDYDFPRTGPADLFALGVPRETPIHKEVTSPAGVKPIADAVNRNRDNFLKNYRAIVFHVMVIPQGKGKNLEFVDDLRIIWRDGDKLRDDHHFPPMEMPDKGNPPLTAAALLAWASTDEPNDKQLMDSQHEYSWTAPEGDKTPKPKPRVLINKHDARDVPSLDQNAWPEEMQWPEPIRFASLNFDLLDANADTPAGCIGLRQGGEGNSRWDFYVDPKNDYVCVKAVWWEKRGDKYVKTREETLGDLHRVAGRVVAGSQKIKIFGDPKKPERYDTKDITIDLVPLTPADYPAGTFDPASLTTGADVVAY